MLAVHVWSDIACPWCYVGKRRLEAALARAPHPCEVVWHAFELDPASPPEQDLSVASYAERLAQKYGAPLAHAEKMIADMTETARGEGLEFRFDLIRPGNTFDAHRLLHFARLRGKQDALKERFLRGYFCEGARIGDHATLARLAEEVGLDAGEVDAVLGTDAYAADVRADEDRAAAMGVRGVPFFLVGRFGVSGAQAPETLLHVLERAQQEPPPELIEGVMCGPGGCD